MKASTLLLRILTTALCVVSPTLTADTIRIAVATNFATTIDKLAAAYERESDHRVSLSKGSTGKLYNQIRFGAPFDLFLAADVRRPEMLEQQGLAVPGSRFTYAVGELVVLARHTCQPLAIMIERARRIAIANPELAPYGAAAHESLANLDLLNVAQSKLVTGENIGQTYALFHTGNADLAFVARSQVIQTHVAACPVAPNLYTPIKQDAVAITEAAVVRAFIAYLRSPSAAALIHADGYSSDAPSGASDLTVPANSKAAL